METDTDMPVQNASDSRTMESRNLSFPFEAGKWPGFAFFTATQKMEEVILPIICVIGLIGNTVATIIFLNRALRKTSCNLYLAARSISDNGFLITLLLVWIKDTFGLKFSNVYGLCQLILFLTYVCGFVSVWLVFMVTLENYIRICHPFTVGRMCTTKTAKVIILIFCLASLVTYHFPLWILTPHCDPIPKFSQITQALVYTDTILTLVLPILLITFLMVAIIYHLIQTLNQRRHRLKEKGGHARGGSHNMTAKVTKMLFAVSVSYFLLNLPSHVIRIRILIEYTKGVYNPPLIEQGIQKIFQLIYYLSFAVNIIIYIGFGSNFRKQFLSTMCCCFLKQQRQRYVTEAVSAGNSKSDRRTSLTVVLSNNKNEMSEEKLLIGESPICNDK